MARHTGWGGHWPCGWTDLQLKRHRLLDQMAKSQDGASGPLLTRVWASALSQPHGVLTAWTLDAAKQQSIPIADVTVEWTVTDHWVGADWSLASSAADGDSLLLGGLYLDGCAMTGEGVLVFPREVGGSADRLGLGMQPMAVCEGRVRARSGMPPPSAPGVPATVPFAVCLTEEPGDCALTLQLPCGIDSGGTAPGVGQTRLLVDWGQEQTPLPPAKRGATVSRAVPTPSRLPSLN